MGTLIDRLKLIVFFAFLSLPGLTMGAYAQNAEPPKLLVRPGTDIILDSAPCVKAVVPPPGGAVEVAKVSESKSYAIFRALDGQNADSNVTIQKGTKKKPDKSGCEAGVQKQFIIGIDQTPQISTEKSFMILVFAFVLAVLLESAFALLFNWRLFQEFFVGKAWRTPIMFIGALMLVGNFNNLDLISLLFDAHSPRADGVALQGNWFTTVVTAMILAGGSVGVNRILVALGFRSQIRADVASPELNETEAWIAIRIHSKSDAKNFQVNIDEVVPAAGNEPPATVGFVRPDTVWQRLKDLLFPSRSRVPRSGGRKVDTTKFYRITIVDMQAGGKIYDAIGNVIAKIDDARIFRFGSRAILDFNVTVTP